MSEGPPRGNVSNASAPRRGPKVDPESISSSNRMAKQDSPRKLRAITPLLSTHCNRPRPGLGPTRPARWPFNFEVSWTPLQSLVRCAVALEDPWRRFAGKGTQGERAVANTDGKRDPEKKCLARGWLVKYKPSSAPLRSRRRQGSCARLSRRRTRR